MKHTRACVGTYNPTSLGTASPWTWEIVLLKDAPAVTQYIIVLPITERATPYGKEYDIKNHVVICTESASPRPH